MSDIHPAAEMVRCTECDTEHFVADLDFPEPEADTNTQFGWLVAQCPVCGADLKVGLDKLGSLLD